MNFRPIAQRPRHRRSQIYWVNQFRHSTLDYVQLALLGFLFAFAVFAFGGTEAWSQLVIVLTSCLLVMLVLLRPLVDKEFSLSPQWIWLPLVALVVLAAVQLVPLPEELVGRLSPARLSSAGLAASVGTDDIVAEAAEPRLQTLSVSPLATRHSLRLALVALFVLVAVTSYLRSSQHVEKLLLVVFAIGCGQAVLALLQIATGADKLYWTVDPGAGGMMTAGSFVNHSHFSQFVNLAIGAGVGLLFVRLERHHRKRRRSRSEWQVDPSDLLQSQSWIVAGLAVCVLAVCLSLSRNGILSLTIASATAGCLMSTNKHLSWRGWVVSCVPLLVFILLLIFGVDAFYERMSTLEHGSTYVDRWRLTAASLTAGGEYIGIGSGLGTFSLVFPAFDITGSASVATHADNDYAQLFVEAGVAGWLILATALALVATAMYRALQNKHAPASHAVLGLAVGLVAVAIHSFTDFGQRVPAVFLLSVAVVGTLAVLGQLRGQPQRGVAPAGDPPSGRAVRRRLVAAIASVPTAVVAVWMIAGAYANYQAESWWAVAQHGQQRLREGDWQGTEHDYQQLLLATHNAVAWQPDDVVKQYWLNQYRWLSVLHVPTDLDTASTEANREVLLEGVRTMAVQIAGELAAIRALCPTYHPPYLLEGELRGYVLGEEGAATALFAHAATLAKSDPQAQFATGAWAARTGQQEMAARHLSRAVAISPEVFDQACQLLIDELGAVDDALQLTGDALQRMTQLVALLDKRPQYAELAAKLRLATEQRLVQLADEGAASGTQLATLAKQAADAGDHRNAVALYRQALGTNYNQVEWRISLARSLRELRDFDAARREVRICVRLRPDDPHARRLSDALASEVEGGENAWQISPNSPLPVHKGPPNGG